MTDWKTLYERWDEVPEDLKRKIFAAFLKKTPEQLNSLFLREPYAKEVWMKIPELPPQEIERLRSVVKRITEELERAWSPELWDRFWREYQARAKWLWATEKVGFKEAEVKDVLRAVAPPKPKPPVVLPPVPEVCPIDGSPLRQVDKVPIVGPLVLSAEEEYFRRQLGLPVPTAELTWIDVPVTMKVWTCKEDHLFERDATGRLIERTREFLYRKILRERAKLERVTYPPPAPRVEVPPEYAFLRPRRPILPKFEEWLMLEKNMEMWQYVKLPDEERKRLLNEYDQYLKGIIG